MTRIKPTDCPYYLVSRVTLQVTSALKKGFASAGLESLKPAYLGVLMSLWYEDGLKVTELGRRAGLEPSTMTGLLDRMERDGLVTRSTTPGDRRVQHIHLTREGQGIRETVLKVLNRTLARLFSGISREDLNRTKEILRNVLSNAHEEGD